MAINGRNVVATIEVRMTSTRLPGKVLMPIAGKPVLQHVIERHRRSKLTDEVVVTTTINETDEPIVELCEQIKCPYFRGSEEDVLGRIVGAGEEHKADILVQGMSDDPLIDWRYVDQLVEMLAKGDYDCASSEFKETFPIGLGMRVYSFPKLRDAALVDVAPAYREHAGYSIRSQPEKFKVINLEAAGNMHWPTLRLTLDTDADYKLISAVYDALYPSNQDFSAEDVVAFLKKRPELVAINAEVKQKVPTA